MRRGNRGWWAVSILVACGGGGGGGGPGGGGGGGGNPPAPTAAFTAATTAGAGEAIVFDASGSTSGDGSALSYTWDFGEGRRGGGKTLAQAFVTPGPHLVGLTVVDGRARQATVQHTVTITAPPPPARTVPVQGQVGTASGEGLAGVTVTAVGSAVSGTTDALGAVQLILGVDRPVTLHLQKEGYADQFLALTLPASVGTDGYFEATLTPRDAPLTLADATAGGSLVGRDGATLVLPPSALLDGAGAAVSGAIQVSLTPVDVTAPAAGGFPGQFTGLGADASLTPIVSFGTTEFIPTRGGARLQLAPGKSATVELPLYAGRLLDGTVVGAGMSIPLWSLDEQTGLWVREGNGSVVASAGSPTGLAFRATVSHLSWWNSDLGFDPFGPQPKCVYDTDLDIPGGEDTFATATVCNMLAEMDRGSGDPLVAHGPRSMAGVSAPSGGRLPGYSRRVLLGIAGGQILPVPANVPIAFSATALNGTWTGRTVAQGPVGLVEEVLIKMRPLTGGGNGTPISLPFDQTASLETGQVARYTFTGVPEKWARITVSQANASTLAGTVRLLRGATEMGSATFSTTQGQLVRFLPDAGPFAIEISGTANTPGAFRLQVDLVGGVDDGVLTLPFDLSTIVLPAFTSYRRSFDVAGKTGLSMAFQRQSAGTPHWRLRTDAGQVLFDIAITASTTQQQAVLLPAAGRYVVEVANGDGQPLGFRMLGEPTAWVPLPGPGIDVASTDDLAGLLSDRNGAPVIVTVHRTVVGGINNQTISLTRWDGTAWSAIAPDVPAYPRPCQGGLGFQAVGARFDAQNQPMVVYGDVNASDDSNLHVVRYNAGAWQSVGPNDGLLPQGSTFGRGCYRQPVLQFGSDGAPMVTYVGDSVIWVQTLQGGVWRGFVNTAGDSFPTLVPSMDLQVDSAGRPVLVFSDANTGKTNVVRLRTNPSPAWEGVGANGGLIPLPAGNGGLFTPGLVFDTSGNPILGSMAAVETSPGVFTRGVAVTRFDGNNWQGGVPYRISDDSFAGGDGDTGFALHAGDAIMAWVNARNGNTMPVVQRNTAAGWSALGADPGGLPQYTPHGLIMNSAWSLKLLSTGGELYLGLVDRDPSAGTDIQRVRVLRYVH